ncbi:tRNA-modifying protein YgfZ [Planctobacterium marinum]
MAHLTPLSHFKILKFTGPDAESYLQGQITNDTAQLQQDNAQLACQCDAKGKVLSTFYLIRQKEALLLIGLAESLALSEAAFKKFAVFSKLEIEDVSEQLHLYGLGKEAFSQLSTEFADLQLPESAFAKSQTSEAELFKLPGNSERFILVSSKSLENVEISDNIEAWQCAGIQAGITHLAEHASAEYIPQMLNLQALNAISFTKGCYMGQETVARAKYLGKNKRAGFILSGKLAVPAQVDDNIEMQLGENWRRAGTIASIVNSGQTGETWIFAVLPNDLEADAVLRLKSMPDSRLNIHPLPYSIE